MKKAWTRAVSAACAAILCILAAFAPVYASDLVTEEAAAVVTDDSEAAAALTDDFEAAESTMTIIDE